MRTTSDKNIQNLLIILLFIVVIGTGLVYLVQSGIINAASFGFEKNTQERKSADAESVAECRLSCEEMLAGWLEMNPDSKNYTRQQEKIAAKAAQCLAMNTLAGSPFSDEDILLSCGLEVECVEFPLHTSIDNGDCGTIAFIEERNLPQCCTEDRPRINCEADAEWVVGFATGPGCFIPNS